MSVIHSNPLKMPVIEIQEGLPYFFINNATNLIQYRGTVGCLIPAVSQVTV